MIALLYPGQGSQEPGMLGALPDHRAVADTLEEAGALLGGPVADLDAAPASTVAAQLALFVAATSVDRALRAEGVVPDIVAGHSVGAFAAAVGAGALTFAEGLSAVRLRAELMESLFPAGFGMVAVTGLGESRVRGLVGTDGPLSVAVVNAPDQVVVSGPADTLDRFTDPARAAGARRVRRLDVAVPSHSPALLPVRNALHEHLASVPRRTLGCPYVANTTARAVTDAGAVLDDLADSVARTVQWADANRLLQELGTTVYLQLPPGSVLARLADDTARVVALGHVPLADAVVLATRDREAGRS